jgi:hypothetical protein
LAAEERLFLGLFRKLAIGGKKGQDSGKNECFWGFLGIFGGFFGPS